MRCKTVRGSGCRVGDDTVKEDYMEFGVSFGKRKS